MTRLEPDAYHRIRPRDRDVLMAAALLNADRDSPPPASTLRDAVGRLSDEPRGRRSIDNALDRLGDVGLIDRVDDPDDKRKRAVVVSADGRQALARGAARLDAAAMGEGERL